MSKNDLWIEDFCLCTNQGQAVTAESLAHTLRELRYGPVRVEAEEGDKWLYVVHRRRRDFFCAVRVQQFLRPAPRFRDFPPEQVASLSPQEVELLKHHRWEVSVMRPMEATTLTPEKRRPDFLARLRQTLRGIPPTKTGPGLGEHPPYEAALWTARVADALFRLSGGVIVDTWALRMWGGEAWRREMALDEFDILTYTLIHVVHGDTSPHTTVWVHTHGMGRFARPDLEIQEVPYEWAGQAAYLLEDIAAYMAHGAVIEPGQHMFRCRDDPTPLTFVAVPEEEMRTHYRNLALRVVDLVSGGPCPPGIPRYIAHDCFQRALDALNRGQTEKAIALLTTSLQQLPQVGVTWLMRGVARREAGDLEGALEDINRAIEIDPTDADFYRERAEVYRALGRPEEAQADLEQAARL